MAKSEANYVVDGSFDWSNGVDSSKATTLQSTLNPNGLPRTALVWLNNATVRNGGITQRTGWQQLLRVIPRGYWQGGFIYEPDGANPYLVCQISGILYKVLLEPPFTVTSLNGLVPALQNPSDPKIAEMAWFVQAENYLIIQAGDYYTQPGANPTGLFGGPSPTLPLIWDGAVLRRSKGLTTPVPTMNPGINEIPAATEMWYHGQRIWYAQGRQVSAGDMVGGPSGTNANHLRDSVLSVTENPLCFGGDGFSLPTNTGNIRALREEVNLNEALGQGRLLIWTRKSVFALTVPPTRTDWINSTAANQPLIVPVQRVNGAVGGRSVVATNGDWFYQSFEPGIRSLFMAVRNYGQWGNTPISQNENRALEVNDRGLMRFSSGIQFDNRMLQLVLPKLAADGNIINMGILPLDFDVVSNLAGNAPPVWEGAYDGLQFLQLFEGDFGGLHRAVAVAISEIDGGIDIWELTNYSRTENGDNRVTWAMEFPAFTWTTSGLEFLLKQLNGGECWVDKVFGTVEMDVWYRVDADPCWRFWMHTQFCAGRTCQEEEPATTCYPPQEFREGYRFPIVFPEPKQACDSMGVRPSTIGYQFQVKIVLKGWCRVRGLLLYALPREKPQFQGVACTTSMPIGMAKLPNLAYASHAVVSAPVPPPPTIPRPAGPTPIKATTPGPANGAGGVNPGSVTLSWANGGGTDSYNVYLNGAPQGNQIATSLTVGLLARLTTYTWRVDSVNAFGMATGDTWTFTTADYDPAFESFEEYGDSNLLNGLNGSTGWNGAWISS